MNTVMDRLYLELANVVHPDTKSSRELALQKVIDRRGVALMMIAEGCSDPAGLAKDVLAEADEKLAARYQRHQNKAAG